MSQMQELGRLFAKGKSTSDKLPVGVFDGGYVVIDNKRYRALWGGDLDAVDGQKVECILDGQKCLVMVVHD